VTLRPILSESCQVSPPRTNCDVEVRDENQREIAWKSVQLSQVIVRKGDPYNQGNARSHQFSDEMAIPFDEIGMDVPVVRYPCRISEAGSPPRQVLSADLTARHSYHLRETSLISRHSTCKHNTLVRVPICRRKPRTSRHLVVLTKTIVKKEKRFTHVANGLDMSDPANAVSVITNAIPKPKSKCPFSALISNLEEDFRIALEIVRESVKRLFSSAYNCPSISE
jgi:hypothetical protein